MGKAKRFSRKRRGKQGRAREETRLVQVFLLLLRKSRRTAFLHLGQHLGSSSGSITYMRHRGQAASTIDVASGLVWHGSPCSVSDERHEEDDDDPRGESTTVAALLDVSSLIGGARFSFRSTLWLFFPWLLRRLILVLCKQTI